MKSRPPLPDRALVAALAAGWGVAAAAVEPLPVGDDAAAWSYRVGADDGRRWFLKLRRGRVEPAAVLVPRWLRDHGLGQAVAAVPAAGGDPWRRLGAFTLLLYGWVDGVPAMAVGLDDRQWVAYGQLVAALHRTVLPADLAATVARESFAPWGAGPVRALGDRLAAVGPGDPSRRELAGLWRAHREVIDRAVGRAEALGRGLAAQRLPTVLCHGDIHTANLLVGRDRRLWVVDWDGLVLAPRERDLMFVVGQVGEREEARFRRGYGEAAVDRAALAYYRWAWVVQELADYGGRVVDDRLDAADRRHALAAFRGLFAPGDVVEAARRADRELRVN